MNQRQLELIEQLQILQILIDFHVTNRERLWQNQREFEEYINDILDQMNEAKAELKELGYYD